MEQKPLARLEEGEAFEGVLWLVAGQVRQTKNGDPFWEGTFQDASASIPAKLWDSGEGRKGRVKAFQDVLRPGGPVMVRAKVDAFAGSLQLSLSRAESVARESVPAALFSPASARPLQEMVAEFDAVVASMEDHHWRRLMEAFRSREEIFGPYSEAPAAKAIHHAWVGGLLEHSLSLARAAAALAPGYPALDRDLILCACFLHDAGKAREISSEPGFEYTTEGKLFGHIYMGGRLVESLSDGIEGFPEEKRRHLLHVVLSHQGERSEGFGSPVDPITPEAVFFHQIDNLDAKVQACLTALEKAEDHQAEGEFTNARLSGLRKSYYRVRPEGPSPTREPEQVETDEQTGPDDSPQPRLW